MRRHSHSLGFLGVRASIQFHPFHWEGRRSSNRTSGRVPQCCGQPSPPPSCPSPQGRSHCDSASSANSNSFSFFPPSSNRRLSINRHFIVPARIPGPASAAVNLTDNKKLLPCLAIELMMRRRRILRHHGNHQVAINSPAARRFYGPPVDLLPRGPPNCRLAAPSHCIH